MGGTAAVVPARQAGLRAELLVRHLPGLADFDDTVIDAFAQLLPEGDYLPLLMDVTPN